MITANDIKIKIRLLNHKNVLAQATVTLFDVWEEYGWKILKSNKIHPIFQEKIWIQAPSYKQRNKDGEIEWRGVVFIDNRELWQEVQKRIYDAYHMARIKGTNQESPRKENQDEKINVDEIPL